MSPKNYLSTHALRGAFFANQLDQLAELITLQGEELLQSAGVKFPSRAVSAALLIGEHGRISAAEIAEALDQPHQLVTQRVDLLIAANVVSRFPDPNDGRRKLLQFTELGNQQFEQLKLRLGEVDRAFEVLFEEIGCDLASKIQSVTDALGEVSLLARL
ncbi:MAG: MarR family transcriptional regulator [Alphaproteobacteria bacterium]